MCIPKAKTDFWQWMLCVYTWTHIRWKGLFANHLVCDHLLFYTSTLSCLLWTPFLLRCDISYDTWRMTFLSRSWEATQLCLLIWYQREDCWLSNTALKKFTFTLSYRISCDTSLPPWKNKFPLGRLKIPPAHQKQFFCVYLSKITCSVNNRCLNKSKTKC